MTLPAGEYGAILADPPWGFRTYSDKGKGRSAEQHYPVMTWQELRQMNVRKLGAKDSILFLWATDPSLPIALDLMGEWGFEYKTVAFTWVKTNRVSDTKFVGMGYWTRANPEMCLLGTRGKPKRLNMDVRQLIEAKRREHSRKPDEIHSRIERLVGGPYIELFARSQHPGWTSWGNEVDKY